MTITRTATTGTGRDIVAGMTSISGLPPQLPDRLLTLVFGHARRLGRAVASDDLFLLALTELDPKQPARRVLADEGIDAERLLAEIRITG